MKIAVSILVACLYLIGTTPVFFSLHYCGGHFEYVTINKVEEKESCCGENERPVDGCCDDTQVSFEVDDQVATKAFFFNTTHVDVLPTPITYFHPKKIIAPLHEVFEVSHSPPLVNKLRLHLLHSVFLI